MQDEDAVARADVRAACPKLKLIMSYLNSRMDGCSDQQAREVLGHRRDIGQGKLAGNLLDAADAMHDGILSRGRTEAIRRNVGLWREGEQELLARHGQRTDSLGPGEHFSGAGPHFSAPPSQPGGPVRPPGPSFASLIPPLSFPFSC